MSPRPYAQGISWRLIGPAIGLWLLAVIALSAIASPATAAQADRPSANVTRTQSAERGSPAEAPALTLVLAGLGLGAGAVAARPARRAVARRRAR